MAVRTGASWRDLPERYGPWQTVHERFARWEADGTWTRLLEQVQVGNDSVGAVEWTVPVDSTVDRAHQHAAGRVPRAGVGRPHRRPDAVIQDLDDQFQGMPAEGVGWAVSEATAKRSGGGLLTLVVLREVC